jgi:hypothetical protein
VALLERQVRKQGNMLAQPQRDRRAVGASDLWGTEQGQAWLV